VTEHHSRDPLRGSPLRVMKAVVCALVLSACDGEQAASVPPPNAEATGSLLTLETRPCNWLEPNDPATCDDVRLVRIGLDGTELEHLTPNQPMSMAQMAVTRDGKTVAWAWNGELWTMEVDTGDERRVNRNVHAQDAAASITSVTWSPDGSQLMYRWDGPDQVTEWHRIDVATGNVQKVKLPIDCRYIALAPAGDSLACMVTQTIREGDAEVDRGDIYRVNLTTLEATQVTAAGDEVDDYAPHWSPDGAWLAMTRWQEEPTAEVVSGLWLVEVATGTGRRVAEGNLQLAGWSPEGNYLVAFDSDSAKLVLVGRDGSDLKVLDHEPRLYINPQWLPAD